MQESWTHKRSKLTISKNAARFIERARAIHGDSYDYSFFVYSGSCIKSKIVCPIHGAFLQTPHAHIQAKHGCQKCSAANRAARSRIDWPTFLVKAQNTHGDRYSYPSFTDLTAGVRTRVPIFCGVHGEFTQEVCQHLLGRGCPVCGSLRAQEANKIDTEEFIRRATDRHGQTFIYDRTNYVGSNLKLEVICRVHGSFMVQASSHLCGAGCKKCHVIKRSQSQRLSTEQFIRRAEKIHGGCNYGYEEAIYVTAHTKLTVICRLHGAFQITPHNHVRGGKGCQQCGFAKLAKTKTRSTEQFIVGAIAIHGQAYDYTDTEYRGRNEKLWIKCKKHGLFEQLATNHLAGNGCPACASSHGENAIRVYLETLGLTVEKQVKFADCGNGRYKFDVGVWIGSQIFIIEYHGPQHYAPTTWFGNITEEQAEANYLSLVERDRIKKTYCESRCIPFLEIPYWDKDRIPEILEKFLRNEARFGSEPVVTALLAA
jgi:hypothetical protein